MMYSAGPEMYDYAYGHGREAAQAFIRFEFLAGGGFCGYRHLTVAVEDHRVVGTACFFDRRIYDRLSCAAVWNIFRFYGVSKALPVLKRMARLGSIMTRPEKGELYLSNLGVHRDRRGCGIGSDMIETKRREAQAAGYGKLSLDVADNNPLAAKLYRRLGFKAVGQKLIAGAVAGCPGYFKMERALQVSPRPRSASSAPTRDVI